MKIDTLIRMYLYFYQVLFYSNLIIVIMFINFKFNIFLIFIYKIY